MVASCGYILLFNISNRKPRLGFQSFVNGFLRSVFVGACRSVSCSHYSFCELINAGVPQCVCPTSCSTRVELVCGSNGRVYENECALRKWSCLNKVYVTVAHIGPCKWDFCCLSFWFSRFISSKQESPLGRLSFRDVSQLLVFFLQYHSTTFLFHCTAFF